MSSAPLDSSDPELFFGMVREHLAAACPGVRLGPVRITYLRYKPEVSTLVGFELRLSEGSSDLTQHYTATTHARREQTDQALAKWKTRRPLAVPFGEPVFTSRSGQTLVCAFPNDAALPGLKIAVDPAKLRHVLDRALLPEGERARVKTLELRQVTYKPERRFVARLVVGSRVAATQARAWRTVYLRVHADQTGESSRRVSELLSERFDFVPRPLGQDRETGIYFQEERVGPALTGLSSAEQVLEVARDAGGKLRRIHTSGLEFERGIGPERLLARLARTAGDLGCLDPELGLRAAELLAALRAAAPRSSGAGGRVGPVHGDFHPGQIVATEGGAVLLDFDEAGLGAPELDLGNFLAHLEVRPAPGPHSGATAFSPECVREALFGGYGADPSDLPDLPWYRSAALLLLAARPFRERDPDWRSRTAEVLRAAGQSPM